LSSGGLTSEIAAEQSAAGETPPPEAPGIGRNTVFALLAQFTTGLFTTVLTLYLVRALGSGGYGIFALAVGIGTVAAVGMDGLSQSTARFLAESRGDGRAVVTALLSDALRLNCLMGTLVTITLVGFAAPIASAFDQPALATPLRAVAIAAFAQGIFLFYTGALGALARVARTVRLVFSESLAETVSSIVLVAFGAGAAGAAVGRAAGYVFGASLAVVAIARMFDRSAVRLRGRGSGRTMEIARYALPLAVISGAYTLYAQANALIIGVLLGTTAVGVFAAPLLLTVPLRYVGLSLAVSVAPRQAGKGKERGSVAAFQTSLRWMIVFQAILLAPLIVWAGPIVALLFGSDYSESANVLRILAVFIFLTGLSPLITTTVNYLGDARRRIPIVLLALGVNVALDFVLLPLIGVVGAAIGTSAAYAIYVPAHFRICQRELGFDARPLGLTIVRVLIAASGMGAVLFAFGTESLSIGDWVIGGALGVVVFCTVLLLTKEATVGDIRNGGRFLIAALRPTLRGIRRRES
jgi:O-antigen/teichoic acid export membrane protein